MIENDIKKEKSRMMFARFCGLFVCGVMFAVFAMTYLGKMNDWVTVLTLLLLSGIAFTLNGMIFQGKISSSVAKINMFLSLIFMLTGLGLMVYGVVSKNLIIF